MFKSISKWWSARKEARARAKAREHLKLLSREAQRIEAAKTPEQKAREFAEIQNLFSYDPPVPAFAAPPRPATPTLTLVVPPKEPAISIFDDLSAPTPAPNVDTASASSLVSSLFDFSSPDFSTPDSGYTGGGGDSNGGGSSDSY